MSFMSTNKALFATHGPPHPIRHLLDGMSIRHSHMVPRDLAPLLPVIGPANSRMLEREEYHTEHANRRNYTF